MGRRNQLVLLFALLMLAVACTHKNKNATEGSPDRTHHVFVDMAGRKVVVPNKIGKILGSSPVGTVLVYTLNPDLLAGWNYQPDPGEMVFIPERYRSLPVLGGWYGKNNTGNLEIIMSAHPDVLLSSGNIHDVAAADRIQQQTRIPVVVLDGALRNLPATYRKLGELTGEVPRANELAGECESTLSEIETKIKAIPAEKRRRYYYAEGPKGLETEPGDGMHTEALDFAGGTNVASVPNQAGYGHAPVSMEQLLQWNPEIIITGYDHNSSPGEFYGTVWSSRTWSRIRAVRNGEVYEAPQYPHNWIDRPPDSNRIIGLKWLAQLFYPESFHYDMRAETAGFYAKFYHVQLSNEQLNTILSPATRKHHEH